VKTAAIIRTLVQWQSAHLRTRLTIRYATLFTLVMIVVATMAQVMIWHHARTSVRAAMTASGQVYDRLWALKAQSLTDSANVLARDFGFRTAVASGDEPTIASALVNLGRRVGVPNAFVALSDGHVVGNGAADLKRVVAQVAPQLSVHRRDAVVNGRTESWRIIASPIMAPVQIGQVVFATSLDDRQMQALESLSAVPLTATILTRAGVSGWQDRQSGRTLRIATDTNDPVAIDTVHGRAFALVRTLPGPTGRPEAALMLSYPLKAALASYWALQLGIALAGISGMLLVVHGSRRLAAQITAPIAALDQAAHALEKGSRTEVEVVGQDEIGRLAESFNRMSAGILERENRISHLAFHDTLTSLPNRAFFREQLGLALLSAPRRGGQVAVLCLDLDGFKGVNDTVGHPIGDALIQIVGQALVAEAHDGIVARLGGDEFAIILSGFDADRPRTLAQAIVDKLKLPVQVDGHQLVTGASIGIAIGPADGPDADALLKNADLALYRAKQDGRGVFRFFEPALDAAARKRRQLELDLREAVATGQFRLAFQPIYDLRSERIGCFEALLRWDHPTRGTVSPADFIPVAEETGLIVAIGEWVMHDACRQAMHWPEHVRVAVNVSPLQFRNSAFASIVLQALGRAGLSPNRLEIEITESIFLEGEGPTVSLLHRLREIGVRIALDDFGTGYSSLSYLRSFPFDKIKIDKSFVQSVSSDPGAVAIVKAIVDLATALDMETTAEGVEDPTQLSTLRGQGCSSIQGFLFSKPVGADETHGLIDRLRRAAA
jgi:diguanylate cyclase (GGDEF)-like protein